MEFLTAGGCREVVGLSVIDLFLTENEVKFKSKLAKALVGGEKEKIKKVRLKSETAAPNLLKLKIARTLIDRQPGLILKIKEAS